MKKTNLEFLTSIEEDCTSSEEEGMVERTEQMDGKEVDIDENNDQFDGIASNERQSDSVTVDGAKGKLHRSFLSLYWQLVWLCSLALISLWIRESNWG